MNNDSGHADGPTGPVSEADLLAEIEGDGAAISPRIGAMRRDRGLLRSIAVEPAPDWLLGAAMDEALGEIDAETIRRLGDGRPASDAPPVSLVVPERFSIASWLNRNRGRVGFAAAAAVVLLVGGIAAYGVVAMLRPVPGSPPIAQGESPATAPLESGEPVPVPAVPSRTEPGDQTRVAGVDELIVPGAVVVSSPVEGAALLAEGRLMIFARGGSSAVVASALEPITSARIGAGQSFALSSGLPASVESALGLPEIGRPAFAAEGGGLPMVDLPRRSVWTATLHAGSTSLASMLNRLRAAGLTVEMRALDEAVPLDPEAETGEVLWWSRPASGWPRPVALPVVIETLP